MIWKINQVVETDQVVAGPRSPGLESANRRCWMRVATFSRSRQQCGCGFVLAN